jgi:hypothetical protein
MGRTPFDANQFLTELAEQVKTRLQTAKAEVAHLKITLIPDGGLGEIGLINLVRNDLIPELSQVLEELVTRGELIINLRAEVAPDLLGTTIREVLDSTAGKFEGLNYSVGHIEQFRPGKPQPTHRFRTAA